MMFDLILDVMNGFSAKIDSIVPLHGAIFLIIPGGYDRAVPPGQYLVEK
jgi:hypothetical protein